MRKFFKPVIALALGAILTTGCKKTDQIASGDFDKSTSAAWSKPTATVPTNADGTISSNLTLTNDKVWLLDGIVYVTNNAQLTINPGTVISSGAFKTYNTANGPRPIRGVLVITKGAKIEATGTPTQPIVFTSPNSGCAKKAGDFGGIVLLGRAPINEPGGSDVIEGIPPLAPPADISYGGSTPADYSGKLQYVRIEYPGFRLDADDEINGLTLGGVGSATVLDHIQVSYSADDSYEFFGGTVNAKHLIALGGDDDDFDFDQGYVGNIQWAVGQKDPNSTHSKATGSTVSDANGIESDNNAGGTTTTLLTRPVISNLTLLGFNSNQSPKLDTLLNGARFRRATQFVVKNSIFAGYPNAVRFESTQTLAYTSPNAIFKNNIVHTYNTLYNPTPPPSYASGNNQSVTSPTSTTAADVFLKLGFVGALNLSPWYIGNCSTSTGFTVNNLYPETGSPALSGANFTDLPATFFTTTTYRGALVSSNNWTLSWVNWNPHTTAY